jgi:hypothetical protein
MRILNLQYNAIDPPNALIPITISGTKDKIAEFTGKYNIGKTEEQQIGDASNNK